MTATITGRFLDREGCLTVRSPAGPGTTGTGAAVRAHVLDRLTAEGWTSLTAHGVRTVVDLRTEDEREVDHHPRRAVVTTGRIPRGGVGRRGVRSVGRGSPGFGPSGCFRPFPERFGTVRGWTSSCGTPRS